MRLAAIDIGTNSTRLLISDFSGSGSVILERVMRITRIGRKLSSTGKISRSSADDTLAALTKYKELMNKHDISKYRAVGTSAVREAENSQWFISYIYENSGIMIDTITGSEEAHLSFSGASRDLSLFSEGQSKKILLLDIGGGSTEFILGIPGSRTGPHINMAKSLNIGSVVLTEMFIKGTMPERDELDRLESYIRSSIREVIINIPEKEDMSIVGVAGTITTLAAIDLELEEYDSKKIHGHELSFEQINRMYKTLCKTDLIDRKQITGLAPGRADIIISGTAILLEILKMLDKKIVIVSEQDILDGIIYSLAEF
ncbi:MAG: Ppx/GppA phosphatase family protein [Candidatus Humimicrobiaceae bacterium]